MASFVCGVLFLLIIISQGNAQYNSVICDNKIGNYEVNSTYQTNLDILLSNLTSNTENNYGFYNFSYGQNGDKVNAIGLCRGDVKQDDCRSCLNDSRGNLTHICPIQKEAISYQDRCMLRYSNGSIFGLMETSPWLYLSKEINATNVKQFNEAVGNLLRNLTGIAASGDSRTKYAAGNETAPNFETIYGLVQCTPDLSEKDCNDCLVGAIAEIPSCCDGKTSGGVIRPSCNIRYENYRFYDAPAPSL
ncbi:hypothetical protein VNO78_19282 [Psophocarpus tetragonolobus]|uniref:Gnk2-homologous domain-containing protein n=1 Tax=Psophocarpus tetragonolobus TaxID=3891 RepID=A0AAN9S8H1_PSOTE